MPPFEPRLHPRLLLTVKTLTLTRTLTLTIGLPLPLTLPLYFRLTAALLGVPLI